MIAIILAGGYATRLGPLTVKGPKPLLEVAGRAILGHIIDRLGKCSEVNKVVIATNTTFENQFKDWLSRNRYSNVIVRAEVSESDSNKPGAIRSLAGLAREFDSDSYLIIAGDNLFTSNLQGFFQYFRDKQCSVVAIYDIMEMDLAKELSVLELDAEGKIVAFQEKPKQPTTTFIGTCIYLLPQRSLHRIYEYLKEGGNPDSPGYFVQWLAKKELVYGYILEGKWWDIGTPESYDQARSEFKSNASGI